MNSSCALPTSQHPNININEKQTIFTFGAIGAIGNHSKSDLFTREENMLFSRVKVSCFHAKAHLFLWFLYIKKRFTATVSTAAATAAPALLRKIFIDFIVYNFPR